MKITNNFVKSAKTGAWVTAVIMLLNYIFSFANVKVESLFSISPATGISPSIGQKLIGLMQSVITFDILSIFTLWVSATAIILIGSLAMEYLSFLPNGKANWQRVALMLLYGTIPFYIWLVGTEIPAMGALVGLGIYYGVVAITFVLGQKWVKKLNLI